MQLSEHPTSPPSNPRGVHPCLHILRSEAEEVKIDGTSQAHSGPQKRFRFWKVWKFGGAHCLGTIGDEGFVKYLYIEIS